jgi:hypothetical protein
MNDLVLQLNKRGTLLEFRGRLVTNFFVPSDESLGKNIYDIMPSDIAHPIMSCVEKALETGDLQSFEYQPEHSTRPHIKHVCLCPSLSISYTVINRQDNVFFRKLFP